MSESIDDSQVEHSSIWIFVLNRPYYPEVEEFKTKEEAENALKAFLDWEEDDGKYETVLYVAKVERRRVTHTHY